MERGFMEPIGSGSWVNAHNRAVEQKVPVYMMALALRIAARNHRARYQEPIGDDAILGKAWLQVARGVVRMLDGNTGGLDGGTVDRSIRDLAEEHGFTRDLEFAP